MPGVTRPGVARPRRVVVADDDPGVRQAIIELLEDDPLIDVVAGAGDGTETIAKCVIYQPDVLVVDVNMPNGGGKLAVEVLSVQLPEMYVVALSANSDRVTRRTMVEAGAATFVAKGDIGDLVAVVREGTRSAGAARSEQPT